MANHYALTIVTQRPLIIIAQKCRIRLNETNRLNFLKSMSWLDPNKRHGMKDRNNKETILGNNEHIAVYTR